MANADARIALVTGANKGIGFEIDEFKGTAIKVNAVCPGYVATDINNHAGPRSTEQGAKIAVKMATIGPDGPTGGYFNDARVIPW